MRNSFKIKVLMLLIIWISACSKNTTIGPISLSEKLASANMEKSVFSGPIVAAHRVNDPIKVQEVSNDAIVDVEVDIFVGLKSGVPTLMIGHEAATATGMTFEQYMENIHMVNPSFGFIWLDCKDLNSSSNEIVYTNTINKMDSLYNIKQRVLIESQYPAYLTNLKSAGWRVSFYANWSDLNGKTYAQKQVVLSEMFNKLNLYNVDGISYDASVDTIMKNYFLTKSVASEPVKMYAWALSRYFGETDLATKITQYNHLSVLLISYVSKQNPLSDGATYKIISALQNEPSKVADVNSSMPIAGTEVTLWTNNYPSTNNQMWKLRSVGAGFYVFKSLADTTKVLQVKAASVSNSSKVEVGTYNPSALEQKWKITYVSNGYYNLAPGHVVTKNLDVNGGATANDTPIQIYTPHTYNSQKFKLVKF